VVEGGVFYSLLVYTCIDLCIIIICVFQLIREKWSQVSSY